MAIGTGTTGSGTVIEVDERQKTGVLGIQSVDIAEWIAPASKDVTGVYTDTKARILERSNESDKLLIGAEGLRALTGGSL